MSFTIGKCKDVVLCDVAPVEACHILLGKSWQIERNVKHHQKTNKISFVHKGHKIKLAPLSPPKEASEDQVKLRKKIEHERKEEKEKEKKDREMREKDSEKKEQKKNRNMNILLFILSLCL